LKHHRRESLKICTPPPHLRSLVSGVRDPLFVCLKFGMMMDDMRT